MMGNDFYKIAREIDSVISKSPTISSERRLIRLLANGTEYEDYMFRNISLVSWFGPLKMMGYFKPDKVLEPIIISDYDTTVYLPDWNVLEYLKKVVSKKDLKEDKNVINEILDILRRVTQSQINKDLKLNSRIWWHFVNILIAIPKEYIKKDILELVRHWITSENRYDLASVDIVKKLLPRFVQEDSSHEDIKKAELVFNIITELMIDEGKSDTSLNPKGVYKTKIDSYWLVNILVGDNLIEKLAPRISATSIFELSNKLINVINYYKDKILIEHTANENTNDRIYVDYTESGFQLTIERPKKGKAKNRIEESSMHDILYGRFEIIKTYLGPKQNNRNVFIKWIGNIIRQINNKYNIQIKTNDRMLTKIYYNIFSDNSYIWMETFLIEEIDSYKNAREALTILLAKLTISMSKYQPQKVKTIVSNFLKSKYSFPIFRRIALLCINRNWPEYKNIFFRELKTINGNIFFGDPHYKAEISNILKNHVKGFDSAESEIINKIIKTGPIYSNIIGNQKYEDKWRDRWLILLKENPHFRRYKIKSKISTLHEDEYFSQRPIARLIPKVSPISENKIAEIPIEDLVQEIEKFVTTEHLDFKGPSVSGFANALKNAVRNQPAKYVDGFDSFINVGYHYISGILDGLKESLNENHSTSWNKIFEFAETYIENKRFWDNSLFVVNDDYKATNRWVIRSLGDLILAGIRKDDQTFNKKQIIKIENIISIIIDKLDSDSDAYKQYGNNSRTKIDPITESLNSSAGSIIKVLIEIALLNARLSKDDSTNNKPKWSQGLKDLYEKTIDKNILDSYTLFGQYLPNFYYLDKTWAKSMASKIYRSKISMRWDAFMYGYLSTRKVYHDIYKDMEKHYARAINKSIPFEHADELLMGHIAIGYLFGLEKTIRLSLYGRVIKKWKRNHIIKLTEIFWQQRDKIKDSELSASILNFWKTIYSKYNKKDTRKFDDTDKQLLGQAAKLLIYLTEIRGESFNWIKLSLPLIQRYYGTDLFVKDLLKLKDKGKSVIYIGKIFIELHRCYALDFDHKILEEFIRFLYKYGDTNFAEIANEVCNSYGRMGSYFLKDIYWEFNSVKDADL